MCYNCLEYDSCARLVEKTMCCEVYNTCQEVDEDEDEYHDVCLLQFNIYWHFEGDYIFTSGEEHLKSVFYVKGYAEEEPVRHYDSEERSHKCP